MERTIEGIFEVERDKKDLGGMNITYEKKTFIGIVKRIKDYTITPSPSSSFSSSFEKGSEEIKGVALEVENEDGFLGKVVVPFARDFSSIERKAILRQRVKYTLSKEQYEENSVGGYLETFKHHLEILSGNFRGETIHAEYSQ